MLSKKYQVFISSTYSDLINERRKALDILLMADCIPAGMEAFVATDNEQFEVIKKVIDLCDYYILIIGKRYGSVNSDTGISYTEMEYDYAKSIDVPVLVFAVEESVELPDDKQETDDELKRKLCEFRNKAMTNRLASIWKSVDELTGAIAISIMRAKSEIVRPGWQRAADYDEAELRREIMKLERRNADLERELKSMKKTVSSFTTQTDIAFTDVEIEIAYGYYSNDARGSTITCGGTAKLMLTELFCVIATEMMDVAITENTAYSAIKKLIPFPKDSGSGFIKDSQLVKKLLNQFKALQLVDSKWSKDKSLLFWQLTERGRRVRDDMILIKNKE